MKCISDLAETDRDSVKQRIREVLYVLRQCESRLRGYEANTENIMKLLRDLEMVKTEIADFQKQLVERHKLPGLPV